MKVAAGNAAYVPADAVKTSSSARNPEIVGAVNKIGSDEICAVSDE